jgi:hypothetical protein
VLDIYPQYDLEGAISKALEPISKPGTKITRQGVEVSMPDGPQYAVVELIHIVLGNYGRLMLKYQYIKEQLRCDVCNTCKGVKEGLFDPYEASPGDVFRFRGPMMLAVPTSEVGRATLVTLDLNRTALLEKRREKIDELELRLIEILKAKDEAARKLLVQALLDDARMPSTQYSACVVEHVNTLRADGHLPADVN